jgi:hypothetical protein
MDATEAELAGEGAPGSIGVLALSEYEKQPPEPNDENGLPIDRFDQLGQRRGPQPGRLMEQLATGGRLFSEVTHMIKSI